MIKQTKTKQAPKSLQSTKNYDGEDVKEQLLKDQHGKCYLCERILTTDFEIEHFKSEHNFTELIQEWGNLFMSCGYCNRKKLDDYDDIINPLDVEVENYIKQELDFTTKKAIFTSMNTDAATSKTIQLLNIIYNGTNKCRKIKEERFIEQIISTVNDFSKLVLNYLSNPSDDNKHAVTDDLSITKEALGFKYWIIKSNPLLYKTFSHDIIWNK